MPAEGQKIDENTCKIVAVSDTGPLLSAFQCGRLDLLRRYFAAIRIPESVRAELQEHGAGDAVNHLTQEGLIVVEHLDFDESIRATRLAERIAASASTKVKDSARHLAEAEAIILMDRVASRGARILLEEKAAREIAQDLRIPLTGFVGILLSACYDGLLTAEEVKGLLESCRRQGTHYSESLIIETYRRCRRMRPK